MKLTILGSSDFRLEYPLASAGYVLQTEATTLKLDFGRGNLVNMATAGIDWKSLDAILLTHMHPDHISDLFQYLQVFAHLNHTGEIKKEMALYGPRGFETFFDHFRRMILTSWDTIPTARDMFDDKVTIGDCSVTTLPMKHSIDDVGYRIESNGRVLVYTGDTEINDNLITLAQNAHALLVECSGTNETPVEGHMRPTDIARVAREAGVRKVILTHYPGDTAQREALVAAVKEECVAEVIGSNDLMTIEI
jgi:ribonuclease BN (tRNA processing enzyme)